MAKKEMALHIRLLADIDDAFRQYVSHRGDVDILIQQMLKEVDLKNCSIPVVQFGGSGAKMTFCHIPADEYARVKKLAATRGCSMNALINGGVAQFTDMLQRKATRSRVGEPATENDLSKSSGKNRRSGWDGVERRKLG